MSFVEEQVRVLSQNAGRWVESNIFPTMQEVVEMKEEIERTSPTPFNRITRFLGLPLRFGIRQVLRPVFQTGFQVMEYEHLEESLNELNNLMDENTMLAIVTSHNSHGDILPGIKLVKAIRSRFPQISNFYFPVAASLIRGVQGLGPQLLYSEGAVPLLKDPRMTPLAAVTDNDKKHRKLKPSPQELRLIIQAAKEVDSAFLVLAEGSVEAGRYDVLGHMKGMQHVTNEFLPFVFQKAHERGRKIVVLPVGIIGSNQMLSAESLLLTWKGVGALIQDWIFRRPPSLAQVRVGSPYEYQIEEGQNLTRTLEAIEEVNNKVLQSIAELKPPLERGYYDPMTREYQEAMKKYEQSHSKLHLLRLQNLLHFRLISMPEELKPIAAKFPKDVEEKLPTAA